MDEDKALKGLEQCSGIAKGGCLYCPYKTDQLACYNLKVMMRDAAGVIRAQKEQIEALHHGVEALRDAMLEEVKNHGRTVGHEGAREGER